MPGHRRAAYCRSQAGAAADGGRSGHPGPDQLLPHTRVSAAKPRAPSRAVLPRPAAQSRPPARPCTLAPGPGQPPPSAPSLHLSRLAGGLLPPPAASEVLQSARDDAEGSKWAGPLGRSLGPPVRHAEAAEVRGWGGGTADGGRAEAAALLTGAARWRKRKRPGARAGLWEGH